jgi:hypothetical protein
MKNNEVSGKCGNVGKRRDASAFWRGNLRERDHLEDLSIDWRTILNWALKK